MRRKSDRAYVRGNYTRTTTCCRPLSTGRSEPDREHRTHRQHDLLNDEVRTSQQDRWHRGPRLPLSPSSSGSPIPCVGFTVPYLRHRQRRESAPDRQAAQRHHSHRSSVRFGQAHQDLQDEWEIGSPLQQRAGQLAPAGHGHGRDLDAEQLHLFMLHADRVQMTGMAQESTSSTRSCDEVKRRRTGEDAGVLCPQDVHPSPQREREMGAQHLVSGPSTGRRHLPRLSAGTSADTQDSQHQAWPT